MINAIFALSGCAVHTNHLEIYERLVPKCHLTGWTMLSIPNCAAL